MERTGDGRLVCPTCRGGLEHVNVVERACRACGARYPVVDGFVDFLASDERVVQTDYVETPDPPARWRFGALNVQLLFDELRRRIAAERERLGRRLDFVDIGAGGLLRGGGGRGGRLFRIVVEHGRSYTGIEPSWAMLRQVRGPDSNLRYVPDGVMVRASGELLPVPAQSADVVLCLSVLDHCADAERVVARAREALRPGGLFVVYLQNDAAWYRRIVQRVAPRYFQRRVEADDHEHRFAPSEARRLLEAAGFTDVRGRDLGYLLAPGVHGLATFAFAPLHIVGPERGARVADTIDRLLERAFPSLGATFLVDGRAGDDA
jgi:SAM-dependent methyltransferase